MVRSGKLLLVAAVALAVVCYFRQPAFVPSPRTASLAALPAIAAATASAPALAKDVIGDAAIKLSAAAYPFMKQVDWDSTLYLMKPGKEATAAQWIKAIDKAIVMGASMDSKLLKNAVREHHFAIQETREGKPLLSENTFERVNGAIGKIVASVPEQQVMDVYNAFSELVDKDVPKYLMASVNKEDAEAAYKAFMDFKDVVKKNPIKPEAAKAADLKVNTIDAAAQKLSEASYPFLKDIDWTSDLSLKPLPGVSANQALKAIDKALVMGISMDGQLLKDAANAHHKAIGSLDSDLVTSLADYTAINAAIGKAVASVPTSEVMGVYNAFAKIVSPIVANNLYSTVKPLDAQAAYNAFMDFKDVVKAGQR